MSRSMQYRITHTTTYRYGESASSSQNIAHLLPRECLRQTCRRCELSVKPEPSAMTERQDFFGNRLSFFQIQEPHRRLVVMASSQVEVKPFVVPRPSPTISWEDVKQKLISELNPGIFEAAQFLFDSTYVPRSKELGDYAAPCFTPGRPLIEAALDLTRRIHADFVFDPSANPEMGTPLTQVLAKRRGVCQDFAHLQIGCLRSLGLAARYVSGYILTSPPPGKPRLVGADASHAWVSIYLPGLGWLDLDPTNDLVVSDRHVTVAWGRDYADISPLQGVILGGRRHTMSVSVDVAENKD